MLEIYVGNAGSAWISTLNITRTTLVDQVFQ